MCKLVTMKTNYGATVKVADIKIDIINEICELAQDCKKIDYIYLFGSSVEDRCTHKSDIDIAIISNVTRSALFRARDYNRFTKRLYDIEREQEYDILQFNSIQALKEKKDFVCKDILEKGQLIYARMEA